MKTPVLFLVFNRPDLTQITWQRICDYAPNKIYIACDGPRNEEDKKDIERLKGLFGSYRGKMELVTLFREKNLGCEEAISSAISWFFDYEDKGIIIEDDCLPKQDFFSFCNELLVKYENEPKVMHIGGTSFLDNPLKTDESYYFSKYSHIWGWATWKRSWEFYDKNMTQFKKGDQEDILNNLYPLKKEQSFRKKIFDKVLSGEINTWDFQWNFSVRMKDGLSVIPRVNLVENLGINHEKATHKISSRVIKHHQEEELSFPLKHPARLSINHDIDKKYYEKILDPSFLEKVKSKVLGL